MRAIPVQLFLCALLVWGGAGRVGRRRGVRVDQFIADLIAPTFRPGHPAEMAMDDGGRLLVCDSRADPVFQFDTRKRELLKIWGGPRRRGRRHEFRSGPPPALRGNPDSTGNDGLRQRVGRDCEVPPDPRPWTASTMMGNSTECTSLEDGGTGRCRLRTGGCMCINSTMPITTS